MEIGEDDNIERKLKVCLPSRVAAILKESPIVLQGNSAIATIDPEDGRRSGVRLEEQAGFTRSIQICRVLTWTLHCLGRERIAI